MGRPRKVSDQDVFAALHRLMNRLGPSQWTLSDVAREVGVTASALVQRFGSKRELQIAFMEAWAEGAPDEFARLRTSVSTPLEAVYAYAERVAQLGESPAGLAHHLAYLQVDLSDPELHSRLKRQATETRASLRALLEEALATGELSGAPDTGALARAVEVTLTGSLMVWGMYQEGPASAALRGDLDALLRPYRSGGTETKRWSG